MEEVKKVTRNGNIYYLYKTVGDLILLQKEYPYEGCSIEDSILFETIEQVESYIDENPIKYEYYVVSYLKLNKNV